MSGAGSLGLCSGRSRTGYVSNSSSRTSTPRHGASALPQIHKSVYPNVRPSVCPSIQPKFIRTPNQISQSRNLLHTSARLGRRSPSWTPYPDSCASSSPAPSISASLQRSSTVPCRFCWIFTLFCLFGLLPFCGPHGAFRGSYISPELLRESHWVQQFPSSRGRKGKSGIREGRS